MVKVLQLGPMVKFSFSKVIFSENIVCQPSCSQYHGCCW